MATIKVNSTAMRDKANVLTGISKSIQSLTGDLMNEMNRLKSTWEGNVAETTVKRFQGLNDDFEERYRTIDNYANFLTCAAEDWDKVNAVNLQGAELQAT